MFVLRIGGFGIFLNNLIACFGVSYENWFPSTEVD